MVDLMVIVGDHGDHWESFPLVARSPREIVLFLDHRMSISDRIKVVDELCPEHVRENVELHRMPFEVDCEQGLHDWEPVERGVMQVAAFCQACGMFAPFPRPLNKPHRRFAVAN